MTRISWSYYIPSIVLLGKEPSDILGFFFLIVYVHNSTHESSVLSDFLHVSVMYDYWRIMFQSLMISTTDLLFY